MLLYTDVLELETQETMEEEEIEDAYVGDQIEGMKI